MIKALLFDYDGVITKPVPDGTLSSRLAKNLSISPTIVAEWMKPLVPLLLTGRIAEEEIWQKLEEKYGKPISVEKRDIWFTWEDLKPLPEMLELVRQFKANGYQIGIVSNASAATIDEIRRNGGYDEFDFAVLSGEVGFKKPDPEIFNAALKHLSGIEANEVLFLDDRQHNTAAAAKLGMETIFVKSHAQAIRDIRRLLKM